MGVARAFLTASQYGLIALGSTFSIVTMYYTLRPYMVTPSIIVLLTQSFSLDFLINSYICYIIIIILLQLCGM